MPITFAAETKPESRMTNFVWCRRKDGSEFIINETDTGDVDAIVHSKGGCIEVNSKMNWQVSKDGKLGLGFTELTGEARKRASAEGNSTKRPIQFRVRFVDD